MTERILAVVFVFIKSVIAATGYGGIVILMSIHSACLPLPSEFVGAFSALLTLSIRALVFRPCVAGDEARRKLARTGEIFSPIRCCHRRDSCRGRNLVRVVALEESDGQSD